MKVKLTIEETLRYQRELIVAVPADWTRDYLDDFIKEVESDSNDLDWFVAKLKRNGVFFDDFSTSLDCPDDTKIECTNIEEMEND